MTEPLTDAEIHDLLTTTLCGPLPGPTMARVFASLATVPEMRARVASLEQVATAAARIDRTFAEDAGCIQMTSAADAASALLALKAALSDANYGSQP